MLVKALGRVRKILEAIDAEAVGNSDNQIALTAQLDQLVAPGASPYGEVVRVGRAFVANTGSAVAAVIALPTTGVLLHLYNQAEDGGRSLVIDWIAASGVAKTAAAGQAQIIANLGQTRVAAPASALTPRKLNGMGTGVGPDTKAIVATAALDAVTGVAAAWFPVGPAIGFPGAAATPGHGLWAAVDGRIIVPPGRSLGIHVIADVVGSTFQAYVGWHEKQLALG